jgi:MFS transporter, SP family, arabinose:H+ symporter
MSSPRLYPVFIAVIVALGGFLLGFDGSVNSGAVPFYQHSLGISGNSFLLGFSTGAIILGSILGNFIAGVLGDFLGRKRALFITGVLFGFAALGTALATSITFFIVAKIIGGIGVGIAILIAPVYIAEVAPAAMRGRLVSINQLNIVLGIFAAYFSNYFILQLVPSPELNWRWMLGMGAFPALMYIVLLFVIPESPRWLMQRKRSDEALAVLKKIGGDVYAANELAQIKESLPQGSSTTSILNELRQLFSRPMTKILTIAFALALFQQLSGINSVLYYAPMVFETSGVGRDNAFLQTIILGLVFVVTTVIAMALIDKIGRKVLLIVGCSLMAVSLFSVSLAFYSASYEITPAAIKSVGDSLLKQQVVELATRANPEHYRYDSVVINDNEAQLILSNDVIAKIDLTTNDVARTKDELALLSTVLTKLTQQSFNSDTSFFAAIQSELKASISSSVAVQGNAFSNLVASNKSADDISAIQFSKIKQLVLNSSIHIHAMIVLLGLLGFIAGFSISLGPVTWTMLAEIFPNHLRGVGISIAGTLNAFTSFVVATSFPSELDYLGSAVTYGLYGLAMFLCVLFVLRYVPETKGKTLEELETLLLVK